MRGRLSPYSRGVSENAAVAPTFEFFSNRLDKRQPATYAVGVKRAQRTRSALAAHLQRALSPASVALGVTGSFLSLNMYGSKSLLAAVFYTRTAIGGGG